jgi:hypothetical protein
MEVKVERRFEASVADTDMLIGDKLDGNVFVNSDKLRRICMHC